MDNSTELSKQALLNQLTKGDFEAFIYDCDGTLADNMGAHKASYKMAAATFNIDLNENIIDELSGWPIIDVATEIKNRYHGSFDPQALAELKVKLFDQEFINDTKPIPFVVNHLKEHAGKLRIGIVSGGERKSIAVTLRLLGIDHLIETMVCAGDSERGKPYADPFLLAAQNLGADPTKCMVFEDGEAGTKGAEAAGMKWVRVDRI